MQKILKILLALLNLNFIYYYISNLSIRDRCDRSSERFVFFFKYYTDRVQIRSLSQLFQRICFFFLGHNKSKTFWKYFHMNTNSDTADDELLNWPIKSKHM